MKKIMLNEHGLPQYFWMEAINTSYYAWNWILLWPILHKTPYKPWFKIKPNMSYFWMFGSKCFILNTKDNLEKLDSKYDEGIFIGCSSISKAYRIYNCKILVIE